MQKLTIKLHTPMEDDRPVYITGNFNNWAPADPSWRMHQDDARNFSFTFDNIEGLPDEIEYKFTRGSWNDVELDDYGNEPPHNRMISRYERCAEDEIRNWRRDGKFHNDRYLPVINIISEQFEIPQLIKTRRITALLPWNYYETDKHFPVIYLQDGQNLFDDFAPFGSWGLAKRLAFLAERGKAEFIVIAIDHAESERIAEFTPTLPTSVLGSGDGEKYARFMAETLKPYIDSHYRTRPEREFTGIGGSSMGGLISIYAAMLHPEKYSRLMLFSPSFWVTPNLPIRFIDEVPQFEGRIYIYGGGRESEMLVGRLQAFYDKINTVNHERNLQVRLSINPMGRHSELEWGREFPMAAEWLFDFEE
ncbi:MAG: hypothetical protein JJU35_02480 [Balneolales bacterium]|nr:hypothetical protein [Balneolales bacterium]